MTFAPTLDISASGMDAQAARLRIIAENLANQDTTGSTPGADPYRRKTITFQPIDGTDGMDGADEAGGRGIERIGEHQAPFEHRFHPSNPAADTAGYVKLPNVNSFVEMMDMREAERSYSADLGVMQVTRTMMARTLEILR